MQLYKHDDGMFGPRWPQKTYTYYRRTNPAGSDINGGSSSTVGGSPLRRKTSAPRPGHRRQGLLQEPAPKPQPAVPRGHLPGSWPRQLDSGVGPARGRTGQAPADEASFRAISASVHADAAALGSGSPQSGRGFPLTKQVKPREARPTEPRDSYASGIQNMVLHPKIPTCSGPDSHNEQTPALKVPLQAELQFHSRGYEQPPHRRTCGTTNSGRLASGLCSSSDGPRADATSRRLTFTSPLRVQTIYQSQRAGGQSAGGADSLVGGEAFSRCHHLSTDDGVYLSTSTAPASAGRPKAYRQVLPPVLATKTRTEDGMLHPSWAATVPLPRHGWRTPPLQSWGMVSTPRS
jgi:hypothetical protein